MEDRFLPITWIGLLLGGIGMSRNKRFILLICCMMATVAAFVLAILKNGIVSIALVDVYDAVFRFNPESASHKLIRDIRLPVAVNTLLYGAAIGMAAILLQRVSRTQAASPTTLGLAPAGMFTIMIIAHYYRDIGQWMLVVTGISGVGGSLLCTFILSRAVPSKLQGMRWLVGGLAVAGIVEIMSLVITLQWRESDFFGIMQTGFQANGAMLPIGSIGIVLGLALSTRLNENTSSQSAWLSGACLVLAVVMTGIAVLTLGVWAFTGLIASVIARYFGQQDYRILMPASAMIGAIIVSVLHTISYSIVPPIEVPLGIVTGSIGLPILIVLVWKEAVRISKQQLLG